MNVLWRAVIEGARYVRGTLSPASVRRCRAKAAIARLRTEARCSKSGQPAQDTNPRQPIVVGLPETPGLRECEFKVFDSHAYSLAIVTRSLAMPHVFLQPAPSHACGTPHAIPHTSNSLSPCHSLLSARIDIAGLEVSATVPFGGAAHALVVINLRGVAEITRSFTVIEMM
jgi:hypothetical protein